MPRYRLLIEYDGSPFVGWQMQAGGASVQGVVTQALAAFADEKVTVHGADAPPACPEPHVTSTRDGRYRAQCFSRDDALVTDLQTGQVVLDAEA